MTKDDVDAALGGTEVVFQDEYDNLLNKVVALVAESESVGYERRVSEEGEAGWSPVDASHGGQACIGYDRFYNRIGECVGNGSRLVFIDGQKDDCDITHWMPLPQPPKAAP